MFCKQWASTTFIFVATKYYDYGSQFAIRNFLASLTRLFRCSPSYSPAQRPCCKHRIAIVSAQEPQQVLRPCEYQPSCRPGYSSFVEHTWSPPPLTTPCAHRGLRGLAFPRVRHLCSSNSPPGFWYATVRIYEQKFERCSLLTSLWFIWPVKQFRILTNSSYHLISLPEEKCFLIRFY